MTARARGGSRSASPGWERITPLALGAWRAFAESPDACEGEPGARGPARITHPVIRAVSVSRQRFAQEIEVLKTIWGPRIAAFLGADLEAERPWPATEYVDGPDLARHVTERGPLPSVLAAALGAILRLRHPRHGLVGVHVQLNRLRLQVRRIAEDVRNSHDPRQLDEATR
ncbi:protein kinase family protein [Streptomyces kebangsaanensis]|uniref:hypothetical protein n=1 Tax=Streptomyces kebangsaanensis TaxID=864058 RepID=UPI000AB0A95A